MSNKNYIVTRTTQEPGISKEFKYQGSAIKFTKQLNYSSNRKHWHHSVYKLLDIGNGIKMGIPITRIHE